MKTVLGFLAGIVVASGVAYFLVQSKSPDAPAEAVTVQSQPVEPAAQPGLQPAPVVVEKPQAVKTERPRRPSPAAVANARAPEPARIANAPVQETPAPAPTPAPVAASTPPPSEPAPSPILRPDRDQPAPPVKKAQTVTVPAGTLIPVRIGETITSDQHQPGDSFTGTLDQPLVINGFVLAERGARVEGRVVEAERAGRVKGLSHLAVELVRLNTADGQRINIQTETFSKEGERSTKQDAVKVGAATAIGAAIGAIAGGGKGAAIGAGAGGAAGTGTVMATRGKATTIPVETRVSFRLRDAVTVTERIK